MSIVKGEVQSIARGRLYGYTQVKLGVEGAAYSPDQSFRWESGENAASCPSPVANLAKDHSPARCSHGIKGSFLKKENPVFSRFSLTAVVEGYGEVVADGKGFRAQRGKLRAVALSDPIARVKPLGRSAFALLSLLSLMGVMLVASASHIFTVQPEFSIGNAVFATFIAVAATIVIRGTFIKGLIPLAKEYDYERKLTKQVGRNKTARNQQVVEDFKKRYPDVEVFNSTDELLESYGDKLRATDLVPAG